MLQYTAAGIPVLTTEFGNRGLGFRPGEHMWQATLAEFSAIIRQLNGLDSEQLEAVVRRARRLTERLYDWQVIADGIRLS